MAKDIKSINADLVAFWNEAMTLSEEDKAALLEEKEEDCRDLAPSPELCEAVSSLKGCKKVLDYGCGTGWASIIALKSGCQGVTAVDLGEGIIDAVKHYASIYGVFDNLNALTVGPSWLSKVPEASFDGFICSNVLDVVPMETAKEIIVNAARALMPGAKAVIGLNYFLSPEMAEEKGLILEDNCLFINGVLRLNSLSDDAWKEFFDPYFEIESLTYFAWPGEKKKTRRLFILKRKPGLVRTRQATLSSSRLILKPIEEADREDMLSIAKDTRVNRTYMIRDFASEDEASAFFNRLVALSHDANCFLYGIYFENRLIGMLNETDKEGDWIELGYFISSEVWNRGFATEALRLAIDELFAMGYRQVKAAHFEENPASGRVMAKAGMKRIEEESDIEWRGKAHRCLYYAIENKDIR